MGRASTGESAKFWLTVLSELKSRGVANVCIVCCDGLTGLPDAIGVTWPQATVQRWVVDLNRLAGVWLEEILGDLERRRSVRGGTLAA